MTERRSTKAIATAALVTLALIALDLGTKAWAVDNLSQERFGDPPPVCQPDSSGRRGMQRLPSESLVLIEGYLEFRYAENCGAAFGLLDEASVTVRRVVFGVAGVAATVVLFLMFVRGSGGGLFAVSVPLIVSGAVGNLVDRGRLGYVVDFIRFHVEDAFEYPTFNVADITITVGVALLIIDGIRQERQTKRSQAEPAESEEPEAEEPEAEEPRSAEARGAEDDEAPAGGERRGKRKKPKRKGRSSSKADEAAAERG